MAGKEEVKAALAAAGSRREARDYLDGFRLRKADLLDIARDVAPSARSGDTVGEITRKIIDNTVGAREDRDAIIHGNWKA